MIFMSQKSQISLKSLIYLFDIVYNESVIAILLPDKLLQINQYKND